MIRSGLPTLNDSSRVHVQSIARWTRFLGLVSFIFLSVFLAICVIGSVQAKDDVQAILLSMGCGALVGFAPAYELYATGRAFATMRRSPRAIDLVAPFQKLRRVFAWMLMFAIVQELLGIVLFLKFRV